MSLKFTNIEEFENYVYNYMDEHDCKEAYVYLRSGYTEKEMLNSNFELQTCSMDILSVCWFWDWIEGQSFIEIASIITENEVIELAKEKEKNKNDN